MLAAPAAAVSLAYLNARWSFENDWRTISGLARSRRKTVSLEKKDKINAFYVLEEYATSPKTADQPFLVCQSQSWTFKQTYDMALRYAGWLHDTYHIKPKEIVAIDFMNCPPFIFLTLALWALGATPAFINYNLTSTPLIHCVRASTARLLLVDPEVRSAISPEVLSALGSPTFRSGSNGGPTELVFLEKGFQTSLPYYPAYRAPNEVRNGTTRKERAVLIYTSGTTGLPKPANVAWNRLIMGGAFGGNWLGLRPCNSSNPDRFYTCMPLYHSSGFVLGFCASLINANTFVLGHRFSTKTFWHDVREGKATVIQYVGETLRYLLAAPPLTDPKSPGRSLDKENNVRMAFGNGLRPDVWDKFKQRFGVETIAEFYASTEGSGGCWNYSSNSFASGAIGRTGTILELFLSREVAVLKHDHETELPYRNPSTGFCEKVPRGTPGEVLYALDSKDIEEKYQGYFNNEEASEKKILRDVLKKDDAWFRTGDLVRWDNEGRWYFVDRIGDTFRWKSENVSTNEVSEVLGQYSQVLEANVYGVQLPGHDGRAGCAAVILDTTEPTAKDLESLAMLAINSLPRYAVPIFLRSVREVQATGNNKQQKHVLRTQGVDPDQIPVEDKIYWLQNGTYVPFERKDWNGLNAGKVRL
jgi:acyl-CoA synthetase (AMP-forming)/AMP-acid ligase II